MENRTDNRCALDELKELFVSYDRRLSRIQAATQDSLMCALAKDMGTEISRLKYQHRAVFVIDVMVTVAIVLVGRCFGPGWEQLVPYLSLLAACVVNAAIEAVECKCLSSMTLTGAGVVEMALKADRYSLLTKRHHLWALVVGVPLVLLAVPQFCAVLKGWDFYAVVLVDHPYHLFVLGFALAMGMGAQVLYYSKIRTTISSLKDNISQYRQLVSNFVSGEW